MDSTGQPSVKDYKERPNPHFDFEEEETV
jgi:hypothetical protein